MGRQGLEQTARELVVEGKGILAADETVPTISKRFEALKILSSEDSRRTYREMLFTTPGAADFISGVILYDETIRQKNAAGIPLVEGLSQSNQGQGPGRCAECLLLQILRRVPFRAHNGEGYFRNDD